MHARRNSSLVLSLLIALTAIAVPSFAQDAVEWMYRHAESVIYPSRDSTRRPEGGAS